MQALSIVLAAAAWALAAGCRAEPAAEPTAAPSAAQAAPPPSSPTSVPVPLVTVALDDASALALLEAAAGILELPLQIQPDARSIVDCARGTANTAGPVPPATALLAIARAVRPYGLVFLQTPRDLLVSKVPGDALKVCAKR